VCSIKGSAEKLPFIPAEEDSTATRFIFRLAETYDLAVWWMFLADVAYEGAVYATSQVIKFACPKPRKIDPNYGSGGPWFGGLDKYGNWQEADFTFNEGSKYYPAGGSGVLVPAGHQGMVAAHAGWTKAHLDTDGFVSARAGNSTTDEWYDYDFADTALGDTASTMVWHKGPNAHDFTSGYSVQWRFTGNQSEGGTAMLLHTGTCSKYGSG